jgi:hypothetical protein
MYLRRVNGSACLHEGPKGQPRCFNSFKVCIHPLMVHEGSSKRVEGLRVKPGESQEKIRIRWTPVTANNRTGS